MRLLTFLVLSTLSFHLQANEYTDALAFAKSKLGESHQIIAGLNTNEIPNYQDNPKEIGLKPTKKGELEAKGEEFVKKDPEASYEFQKADEMKDSKLDSETLNQAKDAIESSNNNKPDVPCSDGGCVTTKPEQSDDFSEGAVALGGLGDVAHDASQHQVRSGELRIFQGTNLTCRIVYGTNRINFCTKEGHVIRGTNSEKLLHTAQVEGRAIRIYGTFCSKRKMKVCREKRQSWCVFQSKLARIVQVEGRRQKGFNFGWVSENINAANCRGFSPEEVSTIKFDTPQMKQSLAELTQSYKARNKSPDSQTLKERVEQTVESEKGGDNV